MKTFLVSILTILLAAQSPQAEANDEKIAGYLIGLVEGSGRVDIVRNGDPIRARRSMALLEGDKILITGEAKISIASNAAQRSGNFTSRNSPILFPVQPSPPPGFWLAFMRAARAAGVSFDMAINLPPSRSAQAPSKGVGDCPQMPRGIADFKPVSSLRSPVQEIEATQRLVVAWHGGHAPYRIDYRAGGAWLPVIDGVCVTHQSVQIPNLAISQNAELKITDSDSKVIAWSFSVRPHDMTKQDRPDHEMLITILEKFTKDERLGIMTLSHLDEMAPRNFASWRLLSAFYEDRQSDPP